MTNELNELFARSIDQLKQLLIDYKQPEYIWKTMPGTSNSAGHLCLHLVGNLNHFIGFTLSELDYQRDRNNEFNGPAVDLNMLLTQLEQCEATLYKTLIKLPQNRLNELFPVQPFKDQNLNTQKMLMHLFGHFNYHLGQINFHQRYFNSTL